MEDGEGSSKRIPHDEWKRIPNGSILHFVTRANAPEGGEPKGYDVFRFRLTLRSPIVRLQRPAACTMHLLKLVMPDGFMRRVIKALPVCRETTSCDITPSEFGDYHPMATQRQGRIIQVEGPSAAALLAGVMAVIDAARLSAQTGRRTELGSLHLVKFCLVRHRVRTHEHHAGPQRPEDGAAEGRDELAPNYRIGDDRGRIYRIVPNEAAVSRSVPNLDQLCVSELVEALNSSNGWQRDRAHMMLIWKSDPACIEPLERLVKSSANPVARVHALWLLKELGGLTPKHILKGLKHPHPVSGKMLFNLLNRSTMSR